MKKILVLLTVSLVVFVVIYRQRVYVWDPIATVTRDGVKQGGVRVMINFTNDTLIDDKSTDKRRIYLVQNWNKQPIYPLGELRCIQFMACMTAADQVAGDKVIPGTRSGRGLLEAVTMTNKQVRFVDERGALVDVELR